MPEQAKETTVVIAGPLVEAAKALRELMAAFRDAAGLIDGGVKFLRRRKAGHAADDLNDIAFAPGSGFYGPLRLIAAGNGTTADVDKLERLLNDTAEGVVQRVRALENYRDTVRRNCGAQAGRKLDDLLDGPDGKFVIRYEIEGLVHMIRDNRTTKTDQKAQAQNTIDKITAFNTQLMELHDLIFPPRGAPK